MKKIYKYSLATIVLSVSLVGCSMTKTNSVATMTNDYVAIASEFQAMAHLPGVNAAKIFEPEPGVVYSWGK